MEFTYQVGVEPSRHGASYLHAKQAAHKDYFKTVSSGLALTDHRYGSKSVSCFYILGLDVEIKIESSSTR